MNTPQNFAGIETERLMSKLIDHLPNSTPLGTALYNRIWEAVYKFYFDKEEALCKNQIFPNENDS